MTTHRTGLLLFAHGARDPRWAAPFEAVAARIALASPSTPIRLAYLELMSPTLLEAGTDLADQGCDAISVVPLFLGAGGHVRRDLPALVAALRTARPALKVTLQPPVGEVESVIDAIAATAIDALRPSPAPETAAPSSAPEARSAAAPAPAPTSAPRLDP